MFFRPIALALGIASVGLITGCGQATQARANAPVQSQNGADPVSPDLPRERMPALYRDYGPLYVAPGSFHRELPRRAWSAWYYPTRSKTLFERDDGALAPLQKYDRYIESVEHHPSHAADYEREHLYNPLAEAWEGLCHAWAVVSLIYPEPKAPVTRGGVTFSVSDQKALLIKSYEEFVSHWYGQKYGDSGIREWSNIRPHLFHRFVTGELIERGRPFIMNKVPGLEVWNTPVWSVSTVLNQDEGDPSVYHVRTVTVGASLLPSPSDQPQSVADVELYTYDLFTRKDASGRDFVITGAWTGVSIDRHPSVLTVLPSPEAGHQSRNPELDPKRVLEILYSPIA